MIVCFFCIERIVKVATALLQAFHNADTYVGLAFTTVEDVVSYIKEHSVVSETDTESGIR